LVDTGPTCGLLLPDDEEDDKEETHTIKSWTYNETKPSETAIPAEQRVVLQMLGKTLWRRR
jgi:hypothetical protein